MPLSLSLSNPVSPSAFSSTLDVSLSSLNVFVSVVREVSAVPWFPVMHATTENINVFDDVDQFSYVLTEVKG